MFTSAGRPIHDTQVILSKDWRVIPSANKGYVIVENKLAHGTKKFTITNPVLDNKGRIPVVIKTGPSPAPKSLSVVSSKPPAVPMAQAIHMMQHANLNPPPGAQFTPGSKKAELESIIRKAFARLEVDGQIQRLVVKALTETINYNEKQFRGMTPEGNVLLDRFSYLGNELIQDYLDRHALKSGFTQKCNMIQESMSLVAHQINRISVDIDTRRNTVILRGPTATLMDDIPEPVSVDSEDNSMPIRGDGATRRIWSNTERVLLMNVCEDVSMSKNPHESVWKLVSQKMEHLKVFADAKQCWCQVSNRVNFN